jgi:hypothetical protein
MTDEKTQYGFLNQDNTVDWGDSENDFYCESAGAFVNGFTTDPDEYAALISYSELLGLPLVFRVWSATGHEIDYVPQIAEPKQINAIIETKDKARFIRTSNPEAPWQLVYAPGYTIPLTSAVTWNDLFCPARIVFEGVSE